MLTRNLLLRIAGPTLVVSLLFLVACIAAAIYLYHRQSESLVALDESIRSRRVAGDLLGVLDEFAYREGPASPEEEAAAPSRIGGLLALAAEHADKGEEARLLARLEAAFVRSGASEAPESPRAVAARALPIARELEAVNASEIERSELALYGTVARVAWGLAALGIVGAVIGVLLGYLAARGLGRAMLRAEELAEVGQLAAGMAHELRNPLTSIKMLVQIDREKAEARGLPSDDLHAIEQEIRRMEGRLNVFMDFAKPPRPERRLLDLATVVDQTIALVGGRASKQRVALRIPRPEAPVMTEADGEQIRQLLVNLALNALDVMPRGGILEIALDPAEDGWIELRVLDTGPGINPKHLSRLYEPFFTSKETGLGLGLAVSLRIAGDHGGTLRATNRPEGGACFALRLPATSGR